MHSRVARQHECASLSAICHGARTGVGAYRQSAMSIALGLAAAAGLLLAAGSAAAEWRVDTTIAPPPVMKPRAPAKRPKVEPPAEESPEAALPERPPADNPEEEEREGRGRDARGCGPVLPAPGTTDGDAGSQAEPREPQDGIIVVGEPTAARDGIADMGQDPRLAGGHRRVHVAAGGIQPLPLLRSSSIR